MKNKTFGTIHFIYLKINATKISKTTTFEVYIFNVNNKKLVTSIMNNLYSISISYLQYCANMVVYFFIIKEDEMLIISIFDYYYYWTFFCTSIHYIRVLEVMKYLLLIGIVSDGYTLMHATNFLSSLCNNKISF